MGLINISQNFLLLGVLPVRRGGIVNFLQILHYIPTGEMSYTYILCSKLCSKHACDAE